MLILTLKARQLINRSVNTFGNDQQRAVWRSFIAEHPDVRHGPADPYEDGSGAFPPDVAEVARSVLNQMFAAMQARLKGTLSEDEIADLSNDLAFVRSVMRTLNRHASRPVEVNRGISA
jgi:hypothetical protein